MVLAGLGWFTVQLLALGRDAAVASAVFQPFIVIESVAVAWAFLALGLTRHNRWFAIGADVSFGVYLSHPLLLQAVRLIMPAGLPGPAITAISLVIGVPIVYLTCAAVVFALRRTPLSLALTGHPRHRPPVAAPAVPVTTPGGLVCERQTA